MRLNLANPDIRRRIALAAMVALLVLLGLTPWPLPRARVQAALAAAFEASGGTALTVDGRSSFVALPLPHVSVQGVHLDYRDGTLAATATRATVGLDTLSLFRGQMVPRNVLFVGLDARAAGAATAPVQVLRELVSAGSAARVMPDLDWLAVREGRLAMAPAAAGGVFDQLDALWLPGAAGQSFELTIKGLWRGETFSARMKGPAAAASNLASRVAARLDIKTRLLDLSFDGHMLGGGNAKADGQITASSPDGTALATWLGVAPPLPGHLDQLSLSGTLTATAGQFALSSASIGLNGNKYDGVAGMRFDGRRPTLSATLNADQADLTDQLQFLVPRRAPDGDWSHETYDASALAIADVDLRLSARQLSIADLTLQDVATSLLLRDGRFEMTLAEATLSGGQAKARIIVSPDGGGVDARAQASLTGADIGDLLTRNFGLRRLSGRLSFNASLASRGRSTAELVGNLDGKANVAVRNGDMLGIDLDRFMARLERRSLLAALDFPAGRTPFDLIAFEAGVKNGLLQVDRCSITSPTLSIDLSGHTAAPDRLLDFKGVVASAENTGKTATTLPFTIRGTWDAPKISPELGALRHRL